MSWKKFLLIAVIASGFAFALAPPADAGVAVGIGIGFPAVYPYPYPHPYPLPLLLSLSLLRILRTNCLRGTVILLVPWAPRVLLARLSSSTLAVKIGPLTNFSELAGEASLPAFFGQRQHAPSRSRGSMDWRRRDWRAGCRWSAWHGLLELFFQTLV